MKTWKSKSMYEKKKNKSKSQISVLCIKITANIQTENQLVNEFINTM